MRFPWSERQDARANVPLHGLRYVVLDTELTSLDTRSNRLLSMGAFAMDGAKIRLDQQFYRVVNPGVEVPAESVLIHKLRNSDVKQGEAPVEVLEELRTFAGDAVLVGHFVEIELNILKKELGSRTLTNPAIDTARVQQWILRNGAYSEDLVHKLENLDLESLARAYNIEFHEAHHALSDAFVTARLWQKMIYALEKMNIRDLRSLQRRI